jgi:hypothetical protein
MSVATNQMRRGTIAALLTATAGCYQSSAPPRWLPSPVEAQRDAFGSWISVQGQPKTVPLVQGELIAIDTDSVHVLADGRLVSLARAALCCAELTAFRMDVSELQLWTVLGILSTGSHGFFLLLTAPMWAIAGTVATSVASYAPRIILTDLVALQPFARFPQGFPPGFDRTTLQSKPWIIPGERRLRQ